MNYIRINNYKGLHEYPLATKMPKNSVQIDDFTYQGVSVFCYLKFLMVSAKLLQMNKELDDVVSCSWHSKDLRCHLRYDYPVRQVLASNSMCHAFIFYIDKVKYDAYCKRMHTKRIKREKVNEPNKLVYEEKQFLFNFVDSTDRYANLVNSVDKSVFEDFNFN